MLPHELNVQTNTAHISNVAPQESGIFLTLSFSPSQSISSKQKSKLELYLEGILRYREELSRL